MIALRVCVCVYTYSLFFMYVHFCTLTPAPEDSTTIRYLTGSEEIIVASRISA